MKNGHQGSPGQGNGAPDPGKVTIETIPDLIATPPPSRDHLVQLVFPSSPERDLNSQGAPSDSGSGDVF
jgi:hypothetical protein